MKEKNPRKNRRYTAEFRKESVKLALSSQCITDTARSLGIPDSTLHTWIKSISDNKTDNKSSEDIKLDPNSLLEENRKLHKELAILKQEKEILKKAAAYFAQEMS